MNKILEALKDDYLIDARVCKWKETRKGEKEANKPGKQNE